MIYVYHLTDAASREMSRIGYDGANIVRLAAGLLEYGTGYELVATVEGSNLDHAWVVTNNGAKRFDTHDSEANWATHPAPGVTMPDELRRERRSSMVGDVFQTYGRSFVVAGVGFLPLPVAG